MRDAAPSPVKRLGENRAVNDPMPPSAKVLPVQPDVQPLHIDYTQTRVLPDAIARVRRLPGVVTGERSELAETFKVLRHQLRHRMREDGHRVLGITSARATASKSLTALNVALSLAADLDMAVMLVDADLSMRGVQQLFGLQGALGLADHLAEGTPIAELLINPGVERMVVLPAGRHAPQNSAELLATRKAQALMAEMKHRYPDRTIVVDLPPLLERADALAFLPHVDTTLLVAEDHGTTTPDLERVAELLAPYNLIGSVLGPLSAPAAGPRSGWRRWFGRGR